MTEWRDLFHVMGEIGDFGQLGTFAALIAIVFQLRGLRERFESLAKQVEVHSTTITELEKTLAQLQGWLAGKEGETIK